jgi:hypothetical protein
VEAWAVHWGVWEQVVTMSLVKVLVDVVLGMVEEVFTKIMEELLLEVVVVSVLTEETGLKLLFKENKTSNFMEVELEAVVEVVVQAVLE